MSVWFAKQERQNGEVVEDEVDGKCELEGVAVSCQLVTDLKWKSEADLVMRTSQCSRTNCALRAGRTPSPHATLVRLPLLVSLYS